ncbi:MAG: DEAD/DEAH box helicase, partial [Clostridiales bacterium]|nr:DEAD/DEAH box helicase [Clostridiales bacterium]
SSQVKRGIEKMNFQTPSPVQKVAIQPILDFQDVFIQAPTGTGKTAAFGVPIIENLITDNNQIQAVVLCPTRELAIQTTEVLKKISMYKEGVRILAIYGGQPIANQIKSLKRRPQIIVATPGRLIDHITRRTTRLDQVKHIILDEADSMLDMGFREDIEKILEAVPANRQTVFLSATIPPEIKKIATSYQHNAQHIVVKADSVTTNQIEQYSVEVKGNKKTTALLALMKEKKFKRSLVFVETKAMAKTLVKQLAQAGHIVDGLHGDLKQSQRNVVMQGYRRGRTKILVATDVAARGIDVSDIEAVVNYDMPRDVNSYIHRIGRTGRANQEGAAYTLVLPRERNRLQDVMKSTKARILPFQLENIAFETDKLNSTDDKVFKEKQRKKDAFKTENRRKYYKTKGDRKKDTNKRYLSA